MEEDLKILKQAENNVLRGIDIESSAIILEKKILDYYIIDVNVLRIATRQILNFIEESKIKSAGDKSILDYVRENVKLKEENKQQKGIIKNSVSKDKIREIINSNGIEVYTREYGNIAVVDIDSLEETLEGDE